MADETLEQKVQTAVMRGYELLAELNQARSDLSAAKEAEERARGSSLVDSATESASAERNRAREAANTTKVNKREIALEEFRVATSNRDQAVKDADEEFDLETSAAFATYDATLSKAIRAQEEAMVMPTATEHRARKEVAALRETFKQHCRNVQEKLGINLEHLVNP